MYMHQIRSRGLKAGSKSLPVKVSGPRGGAKVFSFVNKYDTKPKRRLYKEEHTELKKAALRCQPPV